MNLVPFYAFSFLTVALAFAFAAYLYLWVKRQPTTNQKIIEVSGLIKQGAKTFMNREYRILAVFAVIVAAVLFVLLPTPIWRTESVLQNVFMAFAYLAGAVLSAIAGKIGVMVAALSMRVVRKVPTKDSSCVSHWVPRRRGDGTFGCRLFAFRCGCCSLARRRYDYPAWFLLWRKLSCLICKSRRRYFHQNRRCFC